MTHHDLKCWPEHFAAVERGDKTAELREDDRGYTIGDTVTLHEWCPDMYRDARLDGSAHEDASEFAYTGATVGGLTISHVLRGGPWLADGYVMLSLRRAP